MTTESLSYERIMAARETLSSASRESLGDAAFPGAIDCEDPFGVFVEAKRNLCALIQHLHGDEAFERALDDD